MPDDYPQEELDQLLKNLPDMCLAAAGIKAKVWIPKLAARIAELEERVAVLENWCELGVPLTSEIRHDK